MNQNNGTMLVMGVLLVILILGGAMWGLPKYRIYRQDSRGQANLRQQEWEKKIAIEEAKAQMESAVLKAEAEVSRAKGVAEANRIIGDSLKGNESYLRYLWINNLQQGEGSERIYIPTEAGLPILEARPR